MKRLNIIAGAILAITPATAIAAPPTGSRVDPAPGSVTSVDSKTADAAILAMNQFARCVARQRHRKAEGLLKLPYLSPEQSKETRDLVGGEEACMGLGGGELRFKAPAIFGGIAEQFVLQRYKAADVVQLSALTEDQVTAAGLVPRNTAEDFAQCVVLKQPVASYSLLETRPTTAAETAAVKALAPHLGPCLVKGESLTMSKPAIRSVLAVGLYRALSILVPRAVK